MSAVAVAAVVLVVVALLAAAACAWFIVQRARQRSHEINAQIVEINAQIAENHVKSHRTIDAVNKRLDHTDTKLVESHRTIDAVNKRLDHTDTKLVEAHASMDERHVENHRKIDAVHERLDHLSRIEQLASLDRAASAVHQAASEGRLPAMARKKLLAHLDEVRDELSASEPQA